MKAISIRQPWAWAITQGLKSVENREWSTKYRGECLIHASKGCTKREYQEAVDVIENIDPSIVVPALKDLPRGGLVGSVFIHDCVERGKHRYHSKWFFGKYGFMMRNAKTMSFKPCKGQLGFFEVTVPDEVD